MNIKNFISGKWLKGYKYKYFLPERINHSFIISDSKLQAQIEKASFRLGELNSYAKLVPNIDWFIRSYVMKEAVTSSRIEGTKTNIEEAFFNVVDINPEYKDDWREVNQYVEASNFAIKEIKRIPLSNHLLKETHNILLSQVRGKHKTPGKFRRSQNWIGGTSIQDAVFVPPSPEYVEELTSDLEKFLHNKKKSIPHLIKIAIAHYQFETIHPFLDGNGRIGRLLITLYLISIGILEKPLLYTSDFFEKNKSLYYDKLTFVREKNDLSGWVSFFLQAIETTAENAITTLQEVIKLKDFLLREKILNLGRRSKNAQKFLHILFSQPVISARLTEKEIGVTAKASNELIRNFVDMRILKEITGHKRNRLFMFQKYIEILKR